MGLYFPKHFAYYHEACRVNPAANASPIRKHLITFADSNHKDMLQSLLHSKSSACSKQRELELVRSKKLNLLSKSLLFDLLINKHFQLSCRNYLQTPRYPLNIHYTNEIVRHLHAVKIIYYHYGLVK